MEVRSSRCSRRIMAARMPDMRLDASTPISAFTAADVHDMSTWGLMMGE
jgi:hypothetical protein